MQYLFQSWETFSSEIKTASHTLFLSDYDGTLTPIVGRPSDALLSSGVREKLRALAEKPAFSVGIITGRLLLEVKAMVEIEGIYYAGNHGLEIEGPGLSFIKPEAKAARAEIEDIVRQLSTRLAGIEGVIVEDKGLSLSVHYRLVKKSQEKMVTETFHQITSPLLQDGKIMVSSGKKVLEVRPPIDWHKGKAVETIKKELEKVIGGEIGPVIYLGDDTTDEDAFKVIHRPHGWSIYVGQANPSSNAEYFLESTLEVEALISRMLELR